MSRTKVTICHQVADLPRDGPQSDKCGRVMDQPNSIPPKDVGALRCGGISGGQACDTADLLADRSRHRWKNLLLTHPDKHRCRRDDHVPPVPSPVAGPGDTWVARRLSHTFGQRFLAHKSIDEEETGKDGFAHHLFGAVLLFVGPRGVGLRRVEVRVA